MSKIIRIDDETFSRLQSYAEPLVDTPSDIIANLLDYYENKKRAENQILFKKPQTSNIDKNRREVSSMSGIPNLFLAPAIDENIKKTISSSLSLAEIRNLLSKEELECLEKKSPDYNKLHCWAMTESSRAVFESMREGDIVLFTIRNSGKFQFRGEVTCKIESEKLGNFLWSLVPAKPWKLIYFLRNVSIIDIDKTELVSALTFKSNYNVPGVIRVDRLKLDTALSLYGSLENLMKFLQEKKK